METLQALQVLQTAHRHKQCSGSFVSKLAVGLNMSMNVWLHVLALRHTGHLSRVHSPFPCGFKSVAVIEGKLFEMIF